MMRRTELKRTPFRSKASISAGARNVPLARSSGLSRNTPIRKFRDTPRRIDRVTGRVDEPTPEERAYMAQVRELECCALGQPGHPFCSGRPVAHHAGRHGKGYKSGHYETIPLCSTAHDQLHDDPGNGWTRAAGLDGDGVRAFEDFWIARTQQALGYTPPLAASVPF